MPLPLSLLVVVYPTLSLGCCKITQLSFRSNLFLALMFLSGFQRTLFLLLLRPNDFRILNFLLNIAPSMEVLYDLEVLNIFSINFKHSLTFYVPIKLKYFVYPAHLSCLPFGDFYDTLLLLLLPFKFKFCISFSGLPFYVHSFLFITVLTIVINIRVLDTNDV